VHGLNCYPRLEDGVIPKAVPEQVIAKEVIVVPEQRILAEAGGRGHFFPGAGADVYQWPRWLQAVVLSPECPQLRLIRRLAGSDILACEIAQEGDIVHCNQ
jgi:hypothetical protein